MITYRTFVDREYSRQNIIINNLGQKIATYTGIFSGLIPIFVIFFALFVYNPYHTANTHKEWPIVTANGYGPSWVNVQGNTMTRAHLTIDGKKFTSIMVANNGPIQVYANAKTGQIYNENQWNNYGGPNFGFPIISGWSIGLSFPFAVLFWLGSMYLIYWIVVKIYKKTHPIMSEAQYNHMLEINKIKDDLEVEFAVKNV